MTGRGGRLPATIAGPLLLVLTGVPRSSGAQAAVDAAATQAGPPRPRLAWSPLARIAELGRGAPAAPLLPDVLSEPAPRVGAFWLTRNPGAAAFEFDSLTLPARTEYRAGYTGSSGDFRRPLDPASSGGAGVSAYGGRVLGERVATLGHARLAHDQASGNGNQALGLEPYSASPLVPTDTTSPDMRWTTAVLEGVMGFRLGGWGAGFSTGIEIADARAAHARIGRIERASTPALALGLTRALPVADSRLGLYARATRRNERITTAPLTASETVYPLEGLGEVEPRLLANSPYFRRLERRALLAGLSLGGAAFGARWLVFAERAGLRERQSSAQQAEPPADRWNVDEAHGGGAVSGASADGRLAFLVAGALRSGFGDAFRADLDGRIYRRVVSEQRAAADLRWRPSPTWTLALDGWTAHRRDAVGDPLALRSASLTSWMPGGAAEVVRQLTPRLALSLGGGVTIYTPTSRIPVVDSAGPVWRTLVGPELEWGATPMRLWSGAATLRWDAARGSSAWLRVETELASPGAADPDPLRPTGDRSTIAVSLGVTP